MKIVMIVVRTLMGLLFLLSSVTYFLMVFGVMPMPEIPEGPLKSFNAGLAASGYFFTLLKATELVCGILLLAGRFVPLALVILSPIIINIFLVHVFLAPDPASLAIASFLVIANIFLAWYHWDAFRPLLTPKYEAMK